jgi:hypothetical protein
MLYNVVMPPAVPRLMFHCKICGEPFYRTRARIRDPRHRHPKYCSRACMLKRRQLNEKRNCVYCEKEFYVAPWEKRADRQFCSKKCWSYNRRTRWNREELTQRLFARRRIVARCPELGPCWEYTGCISSGYGHIYVGGNWIRVHKVSAWVFLNSRRAIQRGRSVNVCHVCDNPTCFNPDHLIVGTPRINSRDMVNKGRHASQIKMHCKYGHPFSGNNLVWVKAQSGKMSRVCRTCRNARSREHAHGIKRMH